MVSHTVLQQPHVFTVADHFSSVTLWKLLSVVILQFGDYGYQWAACQPSLLLKHAILSSYILKCSPDKMMKPLAMSCLPKPLNWLWTVYPGRGKSKTRTNESPNVKDWANSKRDMFMSQNNFCAVKTEHRAPSGSQGCLCKFSSNWSKLHVTKKDFLSL